MIRYPASGYDFVWVQIVWMHPYNDSMTGFERFVSIQ